MSALMIRQMFLLSQLLNKGGQSILTPTRKERHFGSISRSIHLPKTRTLKASVQLPRRCLEPPDPKLARIEDKDLKLRPLKSTR